MKSPEVELNTAVVFSSFSFFPLLLSFSPSHSPTGFAGMLKDIIILLALAIVCISGSSETVGRRSWEERY